MPELPEVESVRRGLERHLSGARVTSVEVLDPRPVRHQAGGPQALRVQLCDRQVVAVVRRGKFLWFLLDDGRALAAHLGMSGQLLVHHGEEPARARHLRVRVALVSAAGEDVVMDYVDQRMFGGLRVVDLVPTADGGPGGLGSTVPLVPAHATHVARDLCDPLLDRAAVVRRMRRSRRALKTLLLDQGLVSGVGSIYADEGLWAAGIHGARPGSWLGARQGLSLLEKVAGVMEAALAVGGTSFDALYVNADGESGYFARSLEVYGRAGSPCRRCGSRIDCVVVGGRSHAYCPHCQTRPRRGAKHV